jgi:cytidylate kinase
LDSNRDVSPLTQAADAIHLDNSDMGLKEQYERVRSYADRILEAKK